MKEDGAPPAQVLAQHLGEDKLQGTAGQPIGLPYFPGRCAISC